MLNFDLIIVSMKRIGGRGSARRSGRANGVLAALALFMALAFSCPALAELSKGTMQVGLSTHYLWPQMDVSEFEPNYDWGLVFHYWLNRTTTIMVGFEQLEFDAPFEVDGEDEGLSFSTGVLELGIRYQARVDLWAKPYFEAGIGYHTWTIDPGADFLDSRTGGRIAYFAGTGLAVQLGYSFAAGVNLRYLYMPMSDAIEREAVSTGGGGYLVEEDPLENPGFLSAGVEIVWRFK